MMPPRTVLWLIFCALIFFSALGFSRLPGPYGDNARYIIVAQSLASGKGPVLASAPEAPRDTKYPPGYPLLLAGLIRLFGYNLTLLNALSLLCTLLAAAVAWKFMPLAGVSAGLRVPLAALLALHPLTLEYSRVTLIEAVFVLVLISSLYCLARFETEEKAGWLAAAGLLMAGAFFIRYSALILTVAFIFVLARKKDRAGLAAVCGLAALLLAAAFFYARADFSASYFAEMLRPGNYLQPGSGVIGWPGFAARYAYNAAAYAGDVLAETLLPVTRYILPRTTWWPVKILVGLAFVSVIIAGCFAAWRGKGAKSWIVFVLAYTVLLPVFPTYGSRYLFAVLFFLLMLACAGLEKIFAPRRGPVCALAGVIFVAGALCAGADIYTVRQGFAPAWRNFYRGLEFIAEHAPDEAVVVCRKPFLAYLVARRKSVGFPATADTAAMMDYLRRSGKAYVIVDSIDIAGTQFSRKFLQPALRDHPASFELIYRLNDPETAVYTMKTEP